MALVTILGTGFTGATQCFFGNTAVTIISMNADGTSFTCSPPAGSGTVSIGITSAYGSSVVGTGVKGYTYMAPPTTSSLGTTMGPVAGGTSVVITGTNFYNRQFAPNSNEAFPGVTLPVAFGITGSTGGVINSTQQVTVSTPAVLAAVEVNVNLNTPSGTASTQIYTYIALPILTNTSPAGASGPLAGGTQLRILGSNLSTTSGVTMGGIQGATLQIIEAAGVTLLSPPSSTAGSKTIQVTTAGGVTSSSTITFTYVALPDISPTGIAPAAGVTAGVTIVTITGTNLSNPQFVLFGITAATSTISNSTGATLIAVSPAYLGTQASLPAIVSISVRTAGGTGTLAAAYTYLGPMSISSITPNRGPTGGG